MHQPRLARAPELAQGRIQRLHHALGLLVVHLLRLQIAIFHMRLFHIFLRLLVVLDGAEGRFVLGRRGLLRLGQLNLDGGRMAGDALLVQHEHHVVPGQSHTRVFRHGCVEQRVAVIGLAGQGKLQRNTALVSVDGVRHRAQPDQRDALDVLIRSEGDGAAHLHAVLVVDDLGRAGALRGRAVLAQQVRRREDLRVVVVGGAVATQAAAAVEHGGVRQQHRQTVVDAHDVVGLQRQEDVPLGVVDLGRQLHVARVLVERRAEDVAAGDEDGAVGQHDGGVVHTLPEHAAHAHDARGAVQAGHRDLRPAEGVLDGDDVRVAVAKRAVVVRLAAKGDDLAARGVEHDRVAGGRVLVIQAAGGILPVAVAVRVEPEHAVAGARVEDAAVRPAKQPRVAVAAVGDVNGVDDIGGHAFQDAPALRRRVVDLAVLGPVGAAAPRAADGEDLTVGQSGGRVVAAMQVHVRAGHPFAVFVDAGLLRVAAAGHDDVAVAVHGDAGAEHVVVRVGDVARDEVPRVRVVGGCERLAAGRCEEAVVAPRRPQHHAVRQAPVRQRAKAMRARRGGDGHVDRRAPDALAFLLRDRGGGRVHVDVDDGRESVGIAAAGVLRGWRLAGRDQLDVARLDRLEDGQLGRARPAPGAERDVGPVGAVDTHVHGVLRDLAAVLLARQEAHGEAVDDACGVQVQEEFVRLMRLVCLAGPAGLREPVLHMLAAAARGHAGAVRRELVAREQRAAPGPGLEE